MAEDIDARELHVERWESPLDRALSLAIGGRLEEALRAAVASIEAEPLNVQAMIVLGRLLREAGRSSTAIEVLQEALHRAVHAGQLSSCLWALCEARSLTEGAGALLDEVADRFNKDAQALSDVALPPGLSAVAQACAPLPPAVSGERLLDRAQDAVEKACAVSEQERSAKRAGPAPRHPLFSKLGKNGLIAMMRVLEAELVPVGAVLIEQGKPGEKAYVLARGELEVQRQGGAREAPTSLARLQGGALFGEMALLSRAPRFASVIARRPSVVLYASSAQLDEVAAEEPEVGTVLADFCRKRMFGNLLHASPVLSELSMRERLRVLESFVTHTFEADERLIRQGQLASGIYLLASGSVRVVHNEGAEKTILARLTVGDVVGEVSAILRRPANADVIAEHPTVALYVAWADLLPVVREYPRWLVVLYEIAVARAAETSYLTAQQALPVEQAVLI